MTADLPLLARGTPGHAGDSPFSLPFSTLKLWDYSKGKVSAGGGLAGSGLWLWPLAELSQGLKQEGLGKAAFIGLA